jgi:hypothetical protein
LAVDADGKVRALQQIYLTGRSQGTAQGAEADE